MPQSLSLPAPAKLNLLLHIIGQRADGYHLLESIFQFLDFSDELIFTKNNTAEITYALNLPQVPLAKNIIFQAVEKLKPFRKDPTFGVHIQLNKKLPMGGGLGGGSSNAATTLLALNTLWQLNLSTQKLLDIGLSLGADVPIFLYGHAAFAQGVGEQLTPVSPVEAWYLIAMPDVLVSTERVFSHPDLKRNTPSYLKTPDSWLSGHNDCEPLVKELYPSVAKAYNWLVEYQPTRMTGTGACLFAAFPTKEAAEKVLDKTPKGLKCVVAKGLNSSPAHQALKKQTIRDTNL